MNTIPASQSHPTNRDLAAFALGMPTSQASQSIAEHLSICPICERTISETPRDTLLGIPNGAKLGSSLTGAYRPQEASPTMPGNPEVDPDELPEDLKSQDKYKFLKKLGSGGMGMVYLAEHVLMQRKVAIKLLPAAMTDKPEVVARFINEIVSAAKLEHQNVVRAYTTEKIGRHILFEMEYVNGLDLGAVVEKKGPLPITNAIAYIRQAASGLQQAYLLKMVHRDIKPRNLMLTRGGQIKIADFGLAKFSQQQTRDTAENGLTGDNAVMGTPDYMAPEQARDAKNVDIRADIYSLGCTFYYLLTGMAPYTGATPIEVIFAHVEQPVPDAREFRPEITPELSGFIGRMMAKKADDRPQTPKEVIDGLLKIGKEPEPPILGGTPIHNLNRNLLKAEIKPEGTESEEIVESQTADNGIAIRTTREAQPHQSRNLKQFYWGGSLLAILIVVVTAVVYKSSKSDVDIVNRNAETVSARDSSVPVGTGKFKPLDRETGTEKITISTKEKSLASKADEAIIWQEEVQNKGKFKSQAGVLTLDGGTVPADPKADRPYGRAITDRANFQDVRIKITYRRSSPNANCSISIRAQPSESTTVSRTPTCWVYLGGIDKDGRPRPPGTIRTNPYGTGGKSVFATGVNPSGVTTLEIEVVADIVRTFSADGRLLADAYLGDLPPGHLALWVDAGDSLEVLKMEVINLPARSAAPWSPLVLGARAPKFPLRNRIAHQVFGLDDPNFETQRYGAKGGRYVLLGNSSPGYFQGRNVLSLKGDPNVPGDCDFAVEAVGRVKGGPNKKWGLNFTNWPKPEPNYGIYVQLSADGKVAILPGSFDNSKREKGPLAAPRSHSAIKMLSETNRLLVVSRGRELHVYVNGERVCDPVTLKGDFGSPIAVAFTAENMLSAELDRIVAYTLKDPAKSK